MFRINQSAVMKKTIRFAAYLAAAMLAACQGTAPDDLLLDASQTSLIFVKSNNSSTLDNNFIGGESSDLFMLTPISPNGQLKNLTAEFTSGAGAVADPEISYDGTKVIFSMRKSRGDNFDIYELNLIGKPNSRRLTTSTFDESPQYPRRV
jgi:Tol biopolymer transport system component